MANSRFFGFAQDGEGGVPGTFYLQEKGSRSLSGIAFSPKPIQRFAGLMFDPGTRGSHPVGGSQQAFCAVSDKAAPSSRRFRPFPEPIRPGTASAGCSPRTPVSLTADILFASQAEAAKSALFLDLSEDRLDDRLRILYTARPASVRNFSRIASCGDAAAGGSLLDSTAEPCLSRPVATYRSTSFTVTSVIFASLK